MMSLLPRNKFTMSLSDKFPSLGLFQVICDFCKCQGGDIELSDGILVDSHHGLGFTSSLICISILLRYVGSCM